MKVAITGASGFLGWHTRCALLCRPGYEALVVNRQAFVDADEMAEQLRGADAIIHLAGVNRGSDHDVERSNVWLAERLVAGLVRLDRAIPVVFGNSIHCGNSTAFGLGKARASDILLNWSNRVGTPFLDVRLPNVFGEHGRPFYNSVVATFAHELANGVAPTIHVDREVALLHAHRAASLLIESAGLPSSRLIEPVGRPLFVSELLTTLTEISQRYARGWLPDLGDQFNRELFNTYRSFVFPGAFPVSLPILGDDRGELVESVRSLGGEAQVFVSSTRPGSTRGEHFHVFKTERFQVLRGEATIRLRRLFTEDVLEFHVSGDQPGFIDMPTLWAHSIENTGDIDLLTLFFADDEYDETNADTYRMAV